MSGVDSALASNTAATTAAAQQIDVLFDLGRWSDVVQVATPLMAQAPEPKLLAQMVHALWALDDLAAAKRVLDQGRAQWPRDERFFIYGAQIALTNRLYKQAEREARAGLVLWPQNENLHFALALALWFLGDSRNARLAIEQALALEPSDGRFHSLLAAFLAEHDQELALHHNGIAIASDPTNADYLAMQAALRSGKSREVAARLLRSSLHFDPQSRPRQRRLRELTVLWWVDAALVLVSVALTLLATWWPDRPGWLPTAAGVMLVALGMSMMGRLSRLPMLAALCGLQALAHMSGTPSGLPRRLLRDGWDALWRLDTLANLVGVAVMAGLLYAFLAVLRVAFWNALVHAWDFVSNLSKDVAQGGALAYGVDLLQRPGVRYNLLASALVATTVAPPVPLAMGLMLQVFVLPLVLWAVGAWILPAGTAPKPSIVFMLLCFGLMLATILFVSVSQFQLEQPDHALQAAWALAVWLYAIVVLNNLRQLER